MKPMAPPVQFALALLLAVVLGVAGFLLYRRWRRREAGRRRLRQVQAIAYDMLCDILVPDGNEGQMHVDFVLLTGAGLLVVDLRDVPGAIFGGEYMDEWTVMDGTRRLTFPNPLGPLYDRIAAVKQLAGGIPVEGRVVFTGRGSFPRGRPPRVSMLEGLAGDFPLVEGTRETSPASAWLEGWAQLSSAIEPSPMARPH
jgi:hypothetical protein